MGNVGTAGSRSTACCGKVCTRVIDPDGDVLDELHACDPSGTVFHDTLEDLNEVDRLLLLFAASSSFVAVRWLFVLGANPDACDINGTTCLHAACRSGSTHTVQDLLEQGLAVDATDIAGWTPLHVAMFMGRRAVCMLLLQARADLRAENTKGSTPIDVCNDAILRELALECASHRERKTGLPWNGKGDLEMAEDTQANNSLRFEPFFVPRASFVKEANHITGFQQLGVHIFNVRPGQGLAFLVASGAVRDYPIELSTFLMENSINTAQVGELLGEDFSISQTLRLEFINSIRLTHTGVVTCLAKVFKMIRIPCDMQKIDRLVEGIAQIWWRQHERLQAKAQHQNGAAAPKRSPDSDAEMEGLRLMRLLSGHDMLRQLMFSTIMLHWSLYAPLPPSQRITSQRWLEINAGITAPQPPASSPATTSTTATSEELKSTPPGGGAGEKQQQRQQPEQEEGEEEGLQQAMVQIYKLLSKFFVPQFQIWSRDAGQMANRGMAMRNPSLRPPEADMEGWARFADRGLPQVAGSSSGTVTYKQIRNIHSEATSSTASVKKQQLIQSPASSRPDDVMDPGMAPSPSGLGAPASVAYKQQHQKPGTKDTPLPEGGKRLNMPMPPVTSGGAPGDLKGERVWLSIHHALLFFAPRPNPWIPYAFVQLKYLVVLSVDSASCSICLAPAGSTPSTSNGLRGAVAADALHVSHSTRPQVQIVFLLPDSRWQVVETNQLEVCLSDSGELDRWARVCRVYCIGGQARASGEEDETSYLGDDDVTASV